MEGIVNQELFSDYVSVVRKIVGNHLREVILYGSYARNDFRDDSDIDVMILLDLSDEEIIKLRGFLSAATFDFNLDHDLDIQPIMKSEKMFKKWKDAFPFYANVDREGVRLYNGA